MPSSGDDRWSPDVGRQPPLLETRSSRSPTFGRPSRRSAPIPPDRPEESVCRGVDVDLSLPVSELSPAHKQIVAISKALVRQCDLLIVDEAGVSLDKKETVLLRAVLRQLRGQSTLGPKTTSTRRFARWRARAGRDCH
jgi:hypothetical protein